MESNGTLKIALPQIAPAWMDRDATIQKVVSVIEEAAGTHAELIVFGEALIPGYPFWVGVTGGAAFDDPVQKDFYAHYLSQAVCLADGALAPVQDVLGKHKMAAYVGVIERAQDRGGHSLYCTYVYIDANGNIGSAHRKLMPTHEERLVWSVGDGHGLRTHKLGAFTVGGLNCWENWMPLTRAALYAQGENLHIAGWPGNVRNTEDITPMMAREGRSYVVSVANLMRREDISDKMPHADALRKALPDMSANGGSCIAAPDGSWVLPPETGEETLRYAVIDNAIVRRERQMFDPVGHYSRPDVLSLNVNRTRQACVIFSDDDT